MQTRAGGSRVAPVHRDSISDEEEYYSEDEKQLGKRRKKKSTSGATKKTRGQRGKLHQLTEVPLDILFEVCS